MLDYFMIFFSSALRHGAVTPVILSASSAFAKISRLRYSIFARRHRQYMLHSGVFDQLFSSSQVPLSLQGFRFRLRPAWIGYLVRYFI